MCDWYPKNKDKPVLFYVHTPFCEQLCNFCLCSKEITQDYERVKEYLYKYLSKEFASKFSIHAHKKSTLELNANYDVITIIDTLQHLPEKDKELFIINTFKMLNKKGTLIIKDNLFNNIESINSILNKLGDTVEHSQYSSVVATKHKDKTNIAHYSDIIFDELNISLKILNFFK